MKFLSPVLVLSAFVLAPLGVPTLVAQGTSPAASNPAAPSDAPTQPLSLGDAIRFAQRNSATSRGAEYEAAQADARVRQSRSAFLPTIEGIGQHGARSFNTSSFGINFPSEPGQPPLFDPRGEVIGPVKNIDYRGRITQTLFDFSAISRFHSAQSSAQASHAEAASMAEESGESAALAYIGALRAEDDLRARHADSVLAADLLNIAQQQLNAGVGIALDVTRAQAQVAATRAQLIASRNALDVAQLNLLRALNLPLTTKLTLRDSLATIDLSGLATDQQVAVDRALKDRPDLRAADQQLVAAERATSAVRAERLPSITFEGDKGVNGIGYNRLLNTYTYDFMITVPVFDGFMREGRIQEQQARVSEIEVRRKDLRDQAAVDVQTALLDIASAREQVDATHEQLRLVQQEVEQARERFRAGVAGNADVITASLALTSAHDALTDALTNYQTARVALARAQGAIATLP